MTDAIIVSGGCIDRSFALAFLTQTMDGAGGKKPYLIAADRGLDFFRFTGMLPDLAVGDFDSLSEEGKKLLEEEALEVVFLKPQKDDSDTQAALRLAMERGAKDILILGGTGRRMDHMLANLGLLALGQEQGVQVRIVDAHNEIRIIPSGTVLKKKEQFGTYVSFFPFGGEVKGLWLKGFRYPLTGHCLKISDSGLTVSNEIEEETAIVEYESGRLLMIMSRDQGFEKAANRVCAGEEQL